MFSRINVINGKIYNLFLIIKFNTLIIFKNEVILSIRDILKSKVRLLVQNEKSIFFKRRSRPSKLYWSKHLNKASGMGTSYFLLGHI